MEWWILPGLLLFLVFGAFTKGQRKFLFWRADAKCEDCGADWHDGVMLEAHHVRPLSDGGSNDPRTNGKMLCRPCHADAHEELSQKARRRGDKASANRNAYSARKVRERPYRRNGY